MSLVQTPDKAGGGMCRLVMSPLLQNIGIGLAAMIYYLGLNQDRIR